MRYRLDATPRRIRARRAGHTLADSTRASLLTLDGHHPAYLLPTDDLVADAARVTDRPVTGELGSARTVVDAAGTRIGIAIADGPLAGLTRLDADAADQWLEEDEEIIGHPRDPHRRVDVLESSRHVVVRVDGMTIADTTRPRLVAETGLPPRWYIPRADVRWDLLTLADQNTVCQYKGTAEWWSVGPAPTPLVWGYERPVPEAPKLAGLVAVLAEDGRVETVIDGELQARPVFEPSWLNPSLGLVEHQLPGTAVAS